MRFFLFHGYTHGKFDCKPDRDKGISPAKYSKQRLLKCTQQFTSDLDCIV